MNLTKKVNNLYNENYRKLKKNWREHKNVKCTLCSWMGRINCLKYAPYSKQATDSVHFLFKYQ